MRGNGGESSSELTIQRKRRVTSAHTFPIMISSAPRRIPNKPSSGTRCESSFPAERHHPRPVKVERALESQTKQEDAKIIMIRKQNGTNKRCAGLGKKKNDNGDVGDLSVGAADDTAGHRWTRNFDGRVVGDVDVLVDDDRPADQRSASRQRQQFVGDGELGLTVLIGLCDHNADSNWSTMSAVLLDEVPRCFLLKVLYTFYSYWFLSKVLLHFWGLVSVVCVSFPCY